MNINAFQNLLRKSTTESNGHVYIACPPDGHTQCPKCGKVYMFSRLPGEGTSMEREQHLSGFCSDKCWNAAMGL